MKPNCSIKFLFLTMALAVVFGIVAGTSAASVPLRDNWLTLSTNIQGPRYIVDANGNPFRLFGMARCQFHEPWGERPQYGTIRQQCEHFKKLGCNSMRLSVYFNNEVNPGVDFVEQCGGYNTAGIKKFIDTYVEPDVRGIIDSGMYVMLDLHVYPQTTDPKQLFEYAEAHYIPVWRELAKRYKDEPMIAIYELWNEPYAADAGSIPVVNGKVGDFDWNAAVKDFYIKCGAEIRKYDTRHMMLVSDWNSGWGAAWASTWAVNKYAADPTYKNLLFSVHCNAEHTKGLFDKDPSDGDWENYNTYWADTASRYNIALIFGEVEAEEKVDTDQLPTFIRMIGERAREYHYPVFLWRSRNDERNRTDLWSSFAKSYATPVTVVKNPQNIPPASVDNTSSAVNSYSKSSGVSSVSSSDAVSSEDSGPEESLTGETTNTDSETGEKRESRSSVVSAAGEQPRKKTSVLLVIFPMAGVLAAAAATVCILYVKWKKAGG